MRFLILSLLCCLVWTAQAQDGNDKRLIRKQTKEIVKLYDLDKAQEEAVYGLHQTYFRKLAEIRRLKAEGRQRVYLQKLKSVRMGLQFGIRSVLRPDQHPLFEAERERREQAYLQKLAALKANGASKEALELARIAIE